MKLGYVILYVPDVAKTVEFYTAAFRIELRFLHDSGAYAEMETGATALAFANEKFAPMVGHFVPNRPQSQAAGAEVAFVTDQVEKSFRHALSCGAVSALQPTKKPWGQIVAYVRDLNGFLVEICSPMAG